MKLKISSIYIIIPIVIIFLITLYHIDELIPLAVKSTGPPPEIILQSFQSSDIQKCDPKKNIAFIKTHKTASTSVQNILLRYAYKNQLTVALPIISSSNSLLSSKFAYEMLSLAPWRFLGYNLFCHHMVYNETALQMVMPSNSVYITILRNPVQLFESFYEYSNLREKLGISLEEFATLTKKKGAVEELCRKKKVDVPRNSMLRDFGMTLKDTRNNELVSKMIKHIDKKFHLVMITELFDDSIVLLKQLLCWDIIDVVSFTVNARSDMYKKNISASAAKQLEEWNEGDMRLYLHFLKKLQNSIASFGKLKIQMETADLQEERHNVYNMCISQAVPSNTQNRFKYWTSKVQSFELKVKSTTCENLVKPERELTNDIRMKQLWLVLPDNVAAKLMKITKMSSNVMSVSLLKSVNNVLKKVNKTF